MNTYLKQRSVLPIFRLSLVLFSYCTALLGANGISLGNLQKQVGQLELLGAYQNNGASLLKTVGQVMWLVDGSTKIAHVLVCEAALCRFQPVAEMVIERLADEMSSVTAQSHGVSMGVSDLNLKPFLEFLAEANLNQVTTNPLHSISPAQLRRNQEALMNSFRKVNHQMQALKINGWNDDVVDELALELSLVGREEGFVAGAMTNLLNSDEFQRLPEIEKRALKNTADLIFRHINQKTPSPGVATESFLYGFQAVRSSAYLKPLEVASGLVRRWIANLPPESSTGRLAVGAADTIAHLVRVPVGVLRAGGRNGDRFIVDFHGDYNTSLERRFGKQAVGETGAFRKGLEDGLARRFPAVVPISGLLSCPEIAHLLGKKTVSR